VGGESEEEEGEGEEETARRRAMRTGTQRLMGRAAWTQKAR
jgi:hypothetical protein